MLMALSADGQKKRNVKTKCICSLDFAELTELNSLSSNRFNVSSQGELVELVDFMEFVHDFNNLNQISLLYVTLVLFSSVTIRVLKDLLRLSAIICIKH